LVCCVRNFRISNGQTLIPSAELRSHFRLRQHIDSSFYWGYLMLTVSQRGDNMTELLKKAFDAVSALPPERQNAVAKMILAEIEDEKRWGEAFAGSQDKLAAMADEAIAEHRAGKSRPMNEVL
jgi:hypothetical protein